MRTSKKRNAVPKGGWDSKEVTVALRQARETALRALAHYGEPRMSLEELRRRTAEGISVESLSDWIIKERESGW